MASLEHRIFEPDSFEPTRHFYPRVLNAQLNPLVRFFLSMGNERIAERYLHMHPEANAEAVLATLCATTRHFRWGGADLFVVTDERGVRRMVVIETNSSPSGQKSTPTIDEREQGGYHTLIQRSFMPLLRRRALPSGALAVIYDKNPMEASGYAAAIADQSGEGVHLVPMIDGDPDPRARFVDGVLEVRTPESVAAGRDEWIPVRAAMRYVTQRPWNRIPPLTRTALVNPIVVCLAGGRNKLLADKAYELHNAETAQAGLRIRTPDTIRDVAHAEIPLWVERMGGVAVVKNPYSNAGQGVYTIVNADELARMMKHEQRYDRFIVQALIGNSGWSSRGRDGRLYHVGTIPDRKLQIFVADLRCMVGVGTDGFYPVALYARRARDPLLKALGDGAESWSMLGTNLSVKNDDGSWTTQPERLLLMDNRDFNRLGLGVDDLVEAYMQTVLAIHAIDRMSSRLITQKARFRSRFFSSINPDPALCAEIFAP